MNGGEARPRRRRLLVFGWGAAAEKILQEIAVYAGEGLAEVLCLSHASQAADCDLRDVCDRHGFSCALTDSDDEALSATKEFKPDIIISASYRKKIPGNLLELAVDSINFHPSLLPRHRGCWSGFWAVFDGDAETGVTCHRMVEQFDRGRILHQEHLPILPDDTAASLYSRILPVTAACARNVLRLFFGSGLPEGEEQKGDASYHYRRLPFSGIIQPEWSDEQVERFIRAMHFPPFEGAVACVGGEGGERIEVQSVEHYRRLKPRLAAAAAPSKDQLAEGPSQLKRKAPEGAE